MSDLRVDLSRVVAVAISAATRAGNVIRESVEDHDVQVVERGAKASKEGAGWSGLQTIVRQLIVKALHEAFPELTVVYEDMSEEGGLGEAEETYIATNTSAPTAETDAEALAAEYPAELCSIPLSELCVWVDPLDGIKEVTENNLEAVTCLIGITRNEHPIAGVVGCPFVNDGTVAWGIPGVGSFGIPAPTSKATSEHVSVRSATKAPGLNEVKNVFALVDVVGLGAPGSELWRVLNGGVDMFVLSSPGTYRWDTCAGEALLLATGGGLVDRNGDRYAYQTGPHATLGNNRGVVAWSGRVAGLEERRAVQRVLDATSGTGGTREDILLDVDGAPITAESLIEMLRAGNAVKDSQLPKHVLSIDAPERTRTRGKHSAVARVVIRCSAQCPAAEELRPRGQIQEVLLKRCVVADLLKSHPRPDVKIPRDTRSYNNEAVFYKVLAPVLNRKAGLTVPQTYYAHTEWVPEHPERSRFLTLVESLSPNYEQVSVQDYARMLGALAQLGRLHGYCQGNYDVLEIVRKELWERGSYWDVDKRNKAMPGELDQIAERFTSFVARFADADAHDIFKDPRLGAAGSALQKHAKQVADQLAKEMAEHETLIHGDYKNPNIFFKRGFNLVLPETGAGPETDLHMSMIDFQWSGPGIGAQDVIVLLVTSAPIECLDREKELLLFYLGTLNAHLEARGLNPVSNETFQKLYDYSCLDYFRMLFSYRLKETRPEDIEKLANSFNRGLYTRRMDNLAWLVEKTLDILERFDD